MRSEAHPPHVFEEAYLGGDNPRAQSGFGGNQERWELARRPIVEAIDGPGTFLDIGCANGHLMECVARWSPHPVEPYGLDFAPGLVELARRRLPHMAGRYGLAWLLACADFDNGTPPGPDAARMQLVCERIHGPDSD